MSLQSVKVVKICIYIKRPSLGLIVCPICSIICGSCIWQPVSPSPYTPVVTRGSLVRVVDTWSSTPWPTPVRNHPWCPRIAMRIARVPNNKAHVTIIILLSLVAPHLPPWPLEPRPLGVRCATISMTRMVPLKVVPTIELLVV